MPVCIAAHLIYRSCTRKSLIIFSVEQKNVKKEYKKIHTQPSAYSTAKRQEKKKRNRQNRKMKKQQATALIEEERSGSGQTTVSEDSSEHISKTTTAVLPPVLIDMFRSLKRAYPDMPYWMLRRLYIVYNEWEIEYQNVLFSRYKTVDDDLDSAHTSTRDLQELQRIGTIASRRQTLISMPTIISSSGLVHRNTSNVE